MTYYIPDGYYPSGKARPWRPVEIIEERGQYVLLRYLDAEDETVTAPKYALSKEKQHAN